MPFSIDFSEKLKKNLTQVTAQEARAYIFSRGYSSSSFHMPEYYVPAGFSKFKLNSINWNQEKPLITKTLDIVTPKSYLAWRNFNFLNPYIFYYLVSEITSKTNWKKIQKILAKQTLVASYSTPVFIKDKTEKPGKRAILNWLQMAEKDLIKDCPQYNFLTVTDIKNFYPSIYTHSIAWAIHGKMFMKTARNRFNSSLLGYRLDKLFQNACDGQTNGIPVGSMTSDLIAEVILADVDEKLTKKIKQLKIADKVLISRYRDDYRILSEKTEHGQTVLASLNRILQSEYNLYLNQEKTNSYDDILENALRPWMQEVRRSTLLRRIYRDDYSDIENVEYLKDALLEVYRIQKKFGGSAAITILGKLAEKFYAGINFTNLNQDSILEITSILRKITLLREEATPQVFSILDVLLKKLPRKNTKKTLDAILNVIKGRQDQDYQFIWFYRLCLSRSPNYCINLTRSTKAHPI
ncbi:MAG TPA: RNA-directed DNA polymerase, partial [Candidatus Paceibacterota bacterium]